MSGTIHDLSDVVRITRQIEADIAIAVEEIREFAPILGHFERAFACHAEFMKREGLTVSACEVSWGPRF